MSVGRGTRTARLVAQWAALCASAGSGGGGSGRARDASPGRLAAGVLRGVLTQRLMSYPTTADEDDDAIRMYIDEVEAHSLLQSLAQSQSQSSSSHPAEAAAAATTATAWQKRARRLVRISLATELRAR